MKPSDRQKICSQCEGRVPLDSKECLYCSADLTAPALAEQPSSPFSHQSLQDSLASLYKPPYSGKGAKEQKSPAPAFKEAPSLKHRPVSPSPAEPIATTSMESEGQEAESSFGPLLLLSIGAVLLMLGLLQLFFSDNGVLRLEWNSSYWFVYCLGALPVLFFGFRAVNKLK